MMPANARIFFIFSIACILSHCMWNANHLFFPRNDGNMMEPFHYNKGKIKRKEEKAEKRKNALKKVGKFDIMQIVSCGCTKNDGNEL